MGWYSDTVNFLTADGGAAEGFFNSDLVSGALQGAATSGLNQFFQPDIPKVGYQGKIPELQAVRERVPMQQPTEGQPARRPGSQGRRYFSDNQFAQRPDTPTPTVEEARAAAQTQARELGQAQNPQAPQGLAMGGIASAHNGYYLGGKTDGMADDVPASIDGKQEARLSDGEFVIPADVVSHLGNGNSDAGADQLHGMMNNVRMERTGNPEQGKQIDPNKFMPTMAQGGGIAAYNYGGSVYQRQPKATNFQATGAVSAVPTTPATTTPATTTTATNTAAGVGGDTTTGVDPSVGEYAGKESSLSSWAGDYVTDMLGQGKALGNQAYQAYQGPLSAGESGLQQQAFAGIGSLQAPTNMGVNAFTAADAQAGMNPYLMSSLNPQLEEARRQSEIDRIANAGRMTQAGAFGGSRQALMDMENQRNLQTNLADITGKGYASAYDRAREQFNLDRDKSNQYGFDVLARQEGAGATQRGIESEGMAADYAQFKEERDFPYKQVQYMQSLLQGLPLEAQSVSYNAPSTAAQYAGTAETIEDIYNKYLGGGSQGTGEWQFGGATAAEVEAEYAADPSITPAAIAAKYSQ